MRNNLWVLRLTRNVSENSSFIDLIFSQFWAESPSKDLPLACFSKHKPQLVMIIFQCTDLINEISFLLHLISRRGSGRALYFRASCLSPLHCDARLHCFLKLLLAILNRQIREWCEHSHLILSMRWINPFFKTLNFWEIWQPWLRLSNFFLPHCPVFKTKKPTFYWLIDID